MSFKRCFFRAVLKVCLLAIDFNRWGRLCVCVCVCVCARAHTSVYGQVTDLVIQGQFTEAGDVLGPLHQDEQLVLHGLAHVVW